jgi:RNA polymerase sigma-70 factor (ECF subfamily)
MTAALRGDGRLYEQLLRELGRAIETYIRSRFGSLHFTEDCVQECLLAIHNGRHTYDPKRPFRPWLFTIVRNKTVDLLRRSYSDERAASVAVAREAIVNTDELDNALTAGEILSRLRPQFRHALTLTKVYGYSLSEAAEQTGISESAMKSRVSRAVREAATLLEREREFE